MFDLTVREGLTATAAKNFVDCGIIAGGILGDYDTAYRLGKSAFEVIDRFEARAIASSVNFVFATYVSSWRAPCPEAMAAFEEAYRVGIETGDIQHVGFSLALKLHRLLHTGHELADCQKQLEETIPFLEKSQLSSPRTAIVLVERALARLCYSDATEAQIEQDDQLAEQLVLATKNPQWIYAFGESQAMVSVMLGDYASAEKWHDWTAPQVPSALGLISVPEYHLCGALIATQHCWPAASKEQKEQLLARVVEVRDLLKNWADQCPANFSHKYHLVAAELARIQEEDLACILHHYQQAAETTGSHFIHMRALALELQADFWQSEGSIRFAETLRFDAALLYERWGAWRKVMQFNIGESLGQPMPNCRDGTQVADHISLTTHTLSLTRTATSQRFGQSLDWNSVIKANQLISGEVRSDKLFNKLLVRLGQLPIDNSSQV